jgi:hypothetical protein
MSSNDISRLLIQPRKHYTGTRLQQGRVILDSDFNEDAQLGDEEQRLLLRDLIGPSGSPDDGFSVALAAGDAVIPQPVEYNGAAPVNVLPYRLNSGALYVGGLRFVQEDRDIAGEVAGEIVALQNEFLQMEATDAPLESPGQTHSQLVYVHAQEQDVSPTEDEEFRERSLGGIDTSTRVRRMAKVLVDEVDNDLDCFTAWAVVRDRIETATGGTFDASGVELRSSARLRVTFEAGAALDACSPCEHDDPGRYLGADNQAIRIMLASADRYVWGRDNASPVYRVSVAAPEDGQVRVTMLTPPRDEAHWPLQNTVVEFMPWGALLDNGQKVADAPGEFLRVEAGYDPDSESFALSEADAAALDALTQEWDAAHPGRSQLPNDNDPHKDFLFARFWHRTDDAGDPILLDVNGTHDLLLRLGLRPEFSGGGNAGDFWVVAVRPNTPNVVVPWNLTQIGGVEPHGPRQYFAPLSLITFRPPGPGEPNNAEVVQGIEDCRLRFRPLVDRDGCCTHSVGDGVTSFGDYTSIQTAIDNLPPEGGKVCILPGSYSEEVVIELDGVTVEGCGAQTQISTPPGDSPAEALFQLNASNVTMRDLELVTAGQYGIKVNTEDETGGIASSEITIERVRIEADQREAVGGNTRACIDARRVRNLNIRRCRLSMDGSLTDDSAVFVRGEQILVETCRIESLPGDGSSSSAWAGVQIGGESSGVTIRRNLIAGGVGHGITLGSLIWESTVTTSTTFGPGTGLVDPLDPCAPSFQTVQPVEVENVRYDPTTAGDLEDIRIVDNRIEAMSANGISVLTLLPLEDEGESDLITTDRISIARNRIINNVDQSSNLRAQSPVSKAKKLEAGEEEVFGKFVVSEIPPGGIVLVDGEFIDIRDNEIRDNGTGDPEPVCGISIVYGNGIVIEGNRITNNGLRDSGTMPSGDPTRAGIFVSLAGIASDQASQDQTDTLGTSLRVIGNVVDHPNGPALMARATGPVTVESNHLLSQGSNATAHQPGQAHCVSIVNVGRPWESIDLAPGDPSETRWLMPDRTAEYLARETDPDSAEQRIGEGGRVLFSNNHVSLRWLEPSNVSSGLASGFSVGICTLDAVTCSGNQFSLNVEDPGLKKSGGSFLARQPRISAHVVVVGATAGVDHNRVAEGVNDALISILALGGLLVSSTGNTTTHMSFASTCNTFTPNSSDPPTDSSSERVDRNNLVWLVPAVDSSSSDLVSIASVRSTANQLFSALCTSCLGLTVETETPFTITTFFLLTLNDG